MEEPDIFEAALCAIKTRRGGGRVFRICQTHERFRSIDTTPLPQTVRESLQKWGDRIGEWETGKHIEHCVGRAGKTAEDPSLGRIRVEIDQIRRSVKPALAGVR